MHIAYFVNHAGSEVHGKNVDNYKKNFLFTLLTFLTLSYVKRKIYLVLRIHLAQVSQVN